MAAEREQHEQSREEVAALQERCPGQVELIREMQESPRDLVDRARIPHDD